MSKKALETLTETMFYVLMAFQRKDRCGTEIANYVQQLTSGRIRLGPGTLYTILSNFQSQGLIQKVSSQGRKVIYSLTDKGFQLYHAEIARMKQCLSDAEKEE